MPGERIQRRIDSLLDEADAAVVRLDWETVRDRAVAVLAFDETNADATEYLATAERQLGDAPALASALSSSQAPQPAAPSAFAGERYEVREFLGEGGKKRVFLAHDSLLDREVAFALIRTEGLDDAGRERITREAQAMARLGDHPHIVSVLDLGQEDVDGVSQPYIVSQYMAGGSAKDVLAEADGELPLERTLKLAMDVCRGLEAAHADNVVHRDLSLGNVWLAEDGTAKIGDFGLAVSLDRTRLTQAGMMVGTATYMPPEQALSGAVTPQSDLYSLGVMLYELVTGRPPFVGDDPTAVISQHINTPPVAPSWHSEHCPPDLEALILHLLQKVPEDRPESASEVLAALERVDPAAKSESHSGSGANPLDRLAQGVFVGRQAELERLRSAFDRAFAGQGNVAMLVGEPGSGKTRTSMELETYARMRGAQVLVGRTHESEGMPSYWPWIEVGNENARTMPPAELQADLDPAQVSELARIFPVLLQLDGVEAPEEITDPASAQFRLFDAYTAFIRAASERTPLMIVLDDLHWADKPSLLLLQHFARSLSRMRVLVVGTYRDTDITRQSALSETLASLNREGGIERVVLRGLSRDEVGSYIEATAHVTPARTLVDRIHDETEGNPFFLTEVVNLMTQEGTLDAATSREIALPDGVKEALGRRLDRLSEEANELLQVASVVGREFRYDDLSALGDHGDDQLFALLEEGLDARVIEETGSAGQYRFTHALMQETLLDELSTTRRVRLHGRIGEALEQRWGDRADERATRLAQHFVESAALTEAHTAKALRYSRLAAGQAEAQSAWAVAVRHLQSCLTIIDETDHQEEDTAELLLALGRIAQHAVEWRLSWRSLMRALDLYRSRSDAVGFGTAAVAVSYVAAERHRVQSVLREALDLLGGRDREVEGLLAGRLVLLGGLSPEEKGPLRAQLDGAIAETGSEELRAMRTTSDALNAEGEGRLAASEALLEQLQHIHEKRGDFQAAASSQVLRSRRRLTGTGQLAEAIEFAERAHEYCLGLHQRQSAGFVNQPLATVLFARGELEEYRRVVDRIPVENFAREQFTGFDLSAQGLHDEAVEHMPPRDWRGNEQMMRAVHGGRARVLWRAGRRDAAQRDYEDWVALWREGVEDARVVDFGVACFDDAFVELATRDLVESVVRDIEGRERGEWRMLWHAGSLDRVIAALYLHLGNSSRATDAAVRALEWSSAQGAIVEEARTEVLLARLDQERGDRQAALARLDRAGTVFERLGLGYYLSGVIELKLELQGVAASDGSDGVTIAAPEPGETLPSGGVGGAAAEQSIDAMAVAVGAERPDVASAVGGVAPDGTVTIFFCDIEGSTALNAQLGDEAWLRLLSEHNVIVEEAAASHRGFIVKHRGDGYMLAFQSAVDAVRCAITIQQAMGQHNDHAEHRLGHRIGMHTGEPVRQGSDFFGQDVNYAARVAAECGAGEILVSSTLREVVAPSGEFTFEARDPVTLRGIDDLQVLFTVVI